MPPQSNDEEGIVMSLPNDATVPAGGEGTPKKPASTNKSSSTMPLTESTKPSKPDAASSPTRTAPPPRDGYHEESTTVTLRKNRTVQMRTVTIVPPPSKVTRRSNAKTAAKSTPSKEQNNPNPFEQMLTPIKDLIDNISKQGERKKTESARERLAKMDPIDEDTRWRSIPVSAEIIFVHGSCAASSQYDRLLGAMYDEIRRTMDATYEGGAVRCHLFDALGCGASTHDPTDYDAYGHDELAKDLEDVVQSVMSPSSSQKKDTHPIFIVAHSYGTSQVIHLLNTLPPAMASRIAGTIFLSGALAGGPSDIADESGPCIMCLPVQCLRPLQPRMNDAFLTHAVHPTADAEVVEENRSICEGNDMAYVRAFYRQSKWATVEDARKVKTKALVVHGEDDKVIILGGGEHLNDTLPNSEMRVVPGASHQVMQERPAEVAGLVLDFIAGE